MRIRMARKATWNNIETTTVQGLLVFLGFGLETTISSNMDPTSYRREPDVRRRFRFHWFCCRLRVRCLLQHHGRAIGSTQPRGAQRFQNWNTFLPQSPPPEQRRKHEAPGRL